MNRDLFYVDGHYWDPGQEGEATKSLRRGHVVVTPQGNGGKYCQTREKLTGQKASNKHNVTVTEQTDSLTHPPIIELRNDHAVFPPVR